MGKGLLLESSGESARWSQLSLLTQVLVPAHLFDLVVLSQLFPDAPIPTPPSDPSLIVKEYPGLWSKAA